MSLSLRLRAQVALFACLGLACAARADKLRINSTPAGARVEINGVEVGVTPVEIKYPGGYFRRTKTVLGSRLGHALIARLSFAGYSLKEVVLTEGPEEWVSLKGRNHGQYWLFKADHFEVKLDSIVATVNRRVTASLATGNATFAAERSLEALAALA